MNLENKMEIALDIINLKIVNELKAGCDANSDYFNNLLYEKEQIYAFNQEIIEKTIKVYGKEIKKSLKRGGRYEN